MMKIRKVADASVAAALLLMHIPGLAEKYAGSVLLQEPSAQKKPGENRPGPTPDISRLTVLPAP